MSLSQRNDRKGKCRLCNADAFLCQSHLIPRFIYREFVKSSPTGYMRKSDNINKRVQDGIKAHWLCHKCERSLSQWEKAFSEKIHQIPSNAEKISYDDWL